MTTVFRMWAVNKRGAVGGARNGRKGRGAGRRRTIVFGEAARRGAVLAVAEGMRPAIVYRRRLAAAKRRLARKEGT